MRNQKNSGSNSNSQNKKNKPSSVRDYNPNRNERFSGQRGKRGEKNPLDGLESEKEIVINSKVDDNQTPKSRSNNESSRQKENLNSKEAVDSFKRSADRSEEKSSTKKNRKPPSKRGKASKSGQDANEPSSKRNKGSNRPHNDNRKNSTKSQENSSDKNEITEEIIEAPVVEGNSLSELVDSLDSPIEDVSSSSKSSDVSEGLNSEESLESDIIENIENMEEKKEISDEKSEANTETDSNEETEDTFSSSDDEGGNTTVESSSEEHSENDSSTAEASEEEIFQETKNLEDKSDQENEDHNSALSLEEQFEQKTLADEEDEFSSPTRSFSSKEKKIIEQIAQKVPDENSSQKKVEETQASTTDLSDEEDESSEENSTSSEASDSSEEVEEKPKETINAETSEPSDKSEDSEFSALASSQGGEASNSPESKENETAEITVPEKLNDEVRLDEIVRNRLFQGNGPSKRGGRRGPAEREAKSSTNGGGTPQSDKSSVGVVSFRPKTENSERTLAAKLADVEEGEAFGSGLGASDKPLPEKVVSGQVRSLKKKVREEAEEEDDTPFGSGLVPVKKGEERSARSASKSTSRPTSRPTSTPTPTPTPTPTAPTATTSPNASSAGSSTKAPTPAASAAPTSTTSAGSTSSSNGNRSFNRNRSPRENRPEPRSSVKVSEGNVEGRSEDSSAYDMNSLVSSLDKGGERKLREFRNKRDANRNNKDAKDNSEGVVRAYSAAYMEEQSLKSSSSTAAENNKTEEAEKTQKPSNRDYKRRDERSRKDTERPRKSQERYRNYDRNNINSEETKETPSEENRSDSRRSDSRGRGGPRRSKDKEMDSRNYRTYREEKKSSREERRPQQSSQRAKTTIATPSSSYTSKEETPLFVIDLNEPGSRRTFFVLIFLVLVALVLNFIASVVPEETYKSHYLAAEKCIKYGDWMVAKERLNQAIRKNPSHTKARLAMAYVLFREREEGNSNISLKGIERQVNLIRNILEEELQLSKKQKENGVLLKINDTPASIEGKFLQAVYDELYESWKKDLLLNVQKNYYFQILTKLWIEDSDKWFKTTKQIQNIYQALLDYVKVHKRLPANLTIGTLMTELDPQTNKPFLVSLKITPKAENASSKSNSSGHSNTENKKEFLDGWGNPLLMKISPENFQDSEGKSQKGVEILLTSFGADGKEDKEKIGDGWDRDLEFKMNKILPNK